MGDAWVKMRCDVLMRCDLTPAAKLAYAIVCDRDEWADNGGRHATAREIARATGLVPNYACKVVRRLIEAGLVARVGRSLTAKTGATQSERNPEVAQPPVSAERNPQVAQAQPPGGASATQGWRTQNIQNIQNTQNNTEGAEPFTLTPDEPKPKPAKKPPADPWEAATSSMVNGILRTDAFKAAWLDWAEDRRARHKPLTSLAIRQQIRQLETYGHDGAISSLTQSIANGWTGLFEPKDLDRRSGQTGQRERQGQGGAGPPVARRRPDLRDPKRYLDLRRPAVPAVQPSAPVEPLPDPADAVRPMPAP